MQNHPQSGAAAMGMPGQPQGTNQPPSNNASLYVGDLDDDVTEAMIFEKFSTIGQIISIRVCRDMISKKSLGYAYLNFALASDAERAIDTLNFDVLRGRQMRIMWSQRDPSLRRSGVGNLFIKNLDKSVTTRELYDTFSLFGEILSCKIATDDKGFSKGYGFIHFATKEGADKAIERLNDKVIKNKKIFVAPFMPKTMRAPGEAPEPSFNNIFVKNFGEEMSEEKLRNLFSPYGEITSAKVEMADNNKSRGFGFVCFKEPKSAADAVSKLNNEDFEGKPLFVGRAMKKNERAEFLRQQFEKKKSDKTKRFQQGVNLYVKNLEDTIDDETLKGEFANFGKVTSVRVMRDSNGRSKGFGFVCFSLAEDATKAVTEVNGRLLAGKPLYVALAQRKEERRQHLANQYMQRQLAMRNSMPQQPALMTAPQAQAMNMLMSMHGQGPAAFFPAGVGRMFPQPPGGMGFQPQRPNRFPQPPTGMGFQQHRPNRWNTPQGHMRHMMPTNRPSAATNTGPGIRASNAANSGPGIQYTMNARNITNVIPQPTAGGDVPTNDVTAGFDATTGDAEEKAFINALTSALPEEQKQMLGEKMYTMIKFWYPDLAGKLTGMLLELDNRELMSMYMEAASIKGDAIHTAKTAFRTRVDAAHEVLKKQMTASTEIEQ